MTAPRKALVTGAASGIGLATARLLAGQGWHVTGLDRHERPDGLATKGWILCDLADPQAVRVACNDVGSEFDALILSAGIAGVGDPARVLQINFIAAREMVRSLSSRIRDGGSITLVSSGAGWRWLDRKQVLIPALDEVDDERALQMTLALCESAAEAYNLSKELLCALIAYDCLVHWPRVRLNSVSPGSVATPLIADFTASMGSAAMEFSRATVGRDGTCEEIAEVIAFLSGPSASWINGADIKVDGGLTGALASGAARFQGWES